MKVSKTAKVEKCASKDQARPVLTQLYVRAGSEAGTGTLEATDSYMLVRVPVTLDDDDTPGFVPASVLTDARKGASRYDSDVQIGANGDISYQTKDGGSVHLDRPDIGQWPNAEMLFPTEMSTFEIGVNPKLLAAIADAMGSPDGIVLSFARKSASSIECDSDPLRPIKVRPMRGDCLDADGIVMPIRVGA